MSDNLNEEVVSACRRIVHEGLGVGTTFVDDGIMLVVGLAQRAVLAGLASDCTADMQRRLSEAAEKHRKEHEAELGRPIEEQSLTFAAQHAALMEAAMALIKYKGVLYDHVPTFEANTEIVPVVTALEAALKGE